MWRLGALAASGLVVLGVTAVLATADDPRDAAAVRNVPSDEASAAATGASAEAPSPSSEAPSPTATEAPSSDQPSVAAIASAPPPPTPAPQRSTAPPPPTPAATPVPTPARVGGALVVVGDEDELNESEEALHARLAAHGLRVSVIEDSDADGVDHGAFDLIVISKTVESEQVSNHFKPASGGVIFWEDNAQALPMMATIDDSEQSNTGWHSRATDVEIDARAPSALTGGLTGDIELLASAGEITYAPTDDGGDSTLSSAAIRVARMVGSDRWAYYAYERGAALADGTPAAGRRVYFGLYDDTFRLLTHDGLALFDAAVRWAGGR